MTIQGRWAWVLIIVMFLSLGVNFFVLGFATSRGFLARPFRSPSSVVSLLEDFPPELRRDIARQLWRDRSSFRESVDQLRDKRRQIAEAFRQPIVDENRIRALMGEVRELTGRLQERAQENLLSAVSQLPPEERQRIETGRSRERSPWRQ